MQNLLEQLPHTNGFFFLLPDYYNLNLFTFTVNRYLPHMSPKTATLNLYFYLLLGPIDGGNHCKKMILVLRLLSRLSQVQCILFLMNPFISWSDWHYLQGSQYMAIPSLSVYFICLVCGSPSHFWGPQTQYLRFSPVLLIVAILFYLFSSFSCDVVHSLSPKIQWIAQHIWWLPREAL